MEVKNQGLLNINCELVFSLTEVNFRPKGRKSYNPVFEVERIFYRLGKIYAAENDFLTADQVRFTYGSIPPLDIKPEVILSKSIRINE